MAIARILVDGYSLIHAWPDLHRGHAPHSAKARDALLARLTLYHDVTGTPLTVFFDGQGAPQGTPKAASSRGVEVLYSPPGKTADDLIERVAYRMQAYGEVLVVTNDIAERETVSASGAHTQCCEAFISEVEAAAGGMHQDLRTHNRREKDRWQRGSTHGSKAAGPGRDA
ncbi:MAG: NYN domain-containing protein [Verrucomicrobiota bacterium]|jgi:predicted RNA-binding protein with PIN domain